MTNMDVFLTGVPAGAIGVSDGFDDSPSARTILVLYLTALDDEVDDVRGGEPPLAHVPSGMAAEAHTDMVVATSSRDGHALHQPHHQTATPLTIWGLSPG